MDSTPTDQLIVLRSPFNGEIIKISPESCNPAMLAAMIQAKFVHLNPIKPTKVKERTHGTSEADGH